MDQRVAVGDAVTVGDAVGVVLAAAVGVTATVEARSTGYGVALLVGIRVMAASVIDTGRWIAGGGAAISDGRLSDAQATSPKRTVRIIKLK